MNDQGYKNINLDNIDSEHICCALGSAKNKAGMMRKKEWMKERFAEGMVFRKLDERGKVFIEYLPAAFAWKPIDAPGYLFIHCLWVSGKFKGNNHSRDLLEYCLEEGKKYNGVAVISGEKAFLTGSKFYKYFGFEVADTAPPFFDLMVKRNDKDAPLPKFRENAKRGTIEKEGLVIQYTDQCPFVEHYVKEMRETAENDFGIKTELIHLQTKEQAQNSASPYGTFGVFLNGEFLTYQPMSTKGFTKLLNKTLL